MNSRASVLPQGIAAAPSGGRRTAAVSSRPVVSVVIPAYNAGATLGDSLRSVLAQTLRPAQVIVVDDGSSDDTAAVAQGFGDPVVLLRRANGGIARARNAALAVATGEFIALLDADDLCEPERLAVQVEYLRRNPRVLLCSSDFSAFDDSGELDRSYCGHYYTRCDVAHGGPQARYQDKGELDISGCLGPARTDEHRVHTLQGDVHDELMLGNFVHPPTVMFRREVLAMAGAFDPEIAIACEWEWFVRVAEHGPLGYIDRPLVRYRRSAGQISRSPLMALDSLRVALLLHQRDPRLRQRDPATVRQQLGELSSHAAYAMAESRPATALRLLAVSAFRYHALQRSSASTFLRAVLPAPVIRFLRRLRRTHPAGPR